MNMLIILLSVMTFAFVLTDPYRDDPPDNTETTLNHDLPSNVSQTSDDEIV